MGVITTLFLATAVAIAPHGTSERCLAAQRASRGAVTCSPKDASFVLAGRPAGSTYSIYNYRYKLLQHPKGAMHGGQRLIVFRGKKYIGNYKLQPEVSVAVKGAWLVLKGNADRQAIRLNFSDTPPSRIFVNNEIATFEAEQE